MEQIGTERLDAPLRRWVDMLKEAPPVSEIDMVVLGQAILLIDGLPASAAEELLWGIARAPWRRKEDAGWVKRTFGSSTGMSPQGGPPVGRLRASRRSR